MLLYTCILFVCLFDWLIEDLKTIRSLHRKRYSFMSALYLFQWSARFKAAKCVFLRRLVVRSVYGRLTLDGVCTSYRRRANAGLVIAVFGTFLACGRSDLDVVCTSYGRRPYAECAPPSGGYRHHNNIFVQHWIMAFGLELKCLDGCSLSNSWKPVILSSLCYAK